MPRFGVKFIFECEAKDKDEAIKQFLDSNIDVYEHIGFEMRQLEQDEQL